MDIETPLGKIDILIDGIPVESKISRLNPLAALCPDIEGRYKIEVEFIPDGKEHIITCRLTPILPVQGYSESGENLECYAYYNNDESIKVSIGLEGDTGYGYEKGRFMRLNETYDYDCEFNKVNSEFHNSYYILTNTKTTYYVFGVAWILECNEQNDVQTWFGADPIIM